MAEKSNAIVSFQGAQRVANLYASARYTGQFLPFTFMANYRLQLCCAATLSFTVALAAQPAPPPKRAKPVHSIEVAPKATASSNVEKEAAAKDSGSSQRAGNYV